MDNKYTLIAFDPEECQTFVDYVTAKTPLLAYKLFEERQAKWDDWVQDPDPKLEMPPNSIPSDYNFICVVKGHVDCPYAYDDVINNGNEVA